MNPWEILWAGLGWCMVALLAILMAALLAAVVNAILKSFRSSRRTRTHHIMKSEPKE